MSTSNYSYVALSNGISSSEISTEIGINYPGIAFEITNELSSLENKRLLIINNRSYYHRHVTNKFPEPLKTGQFGYITGDNNTKYLVISFYPDNLAGWNGELPIPDSYPIKALGSITNPQEITLDSSKSLCIIPKCDYVVKCRLGNENGILIDNIMVGSRGVTIPPIYDSSKYNLFSDGPVTCSLISIGSGGGGGSDDNFLTLEP